jgi:hypothetical protein
MYIHIWVLMPSVEYSLIEHCALEDFRPQKIGSRTIDERGLAGASSDKVTYQVLKAS